MQWAFLCLPKAKRKMCRPRWKAMWQRSAGRLSSICRTSMRSVSYTHLSAAGRGGRHGAGYSGGHSGAGEKARPSACPCARRQCGPKAKPQNGCVTHRTEAHKAAVGPAGKGVSRMARPCAALQSVRQKPAPLPAQPGACVSPGRAYCRQAAQEALNTLSPASLAPPP